MPSPPLRRPVVLYDGDCSFCRRWVQRWSSVAVDSIDFEPGRSWGDRLPAIAPAALEQAVHLVERDGAIWSGAAAVFRLLDLAGQSRGPWLAYRSVPGAAAVAEGAYRWVARHRNGFDRLDRLLLGDTATLASYRISNQIFLRLLGLIYVFALVSLWVQIEGLIGSQAILPVRAFLHSAASLGSERYQLLPTLCWLSDSDATLHALCLVGTVAGAAMFAGILQLPATLAAWACYLSLTVAGQDFLGFQWDALLLEAGFLAIFLSPWRLFTWRDPPEPSRVILWLVRWLLLRLMFMSGVVKLSSGDVAWHAWRAMQYHYETQPLPTWTAWWMFQLPGWFHSFSCGVVFVAELVLPLLILFPRRLRLVAFWGIALFQVLIAVTGNFGFFNLLTVVLCCTLVDDITWRRVLRLPRLTHLAPRRRGWPLWITLPLAAALVAMSVPLLVGAFGATEEWPRPILWLLAETQSFRLVNSYGLFAIMTTHRPEIIIEGSDDGITWRPYVFRYKPGDPLRRPQFTTPHMPRLDWQMWFAALSPPQDSPWIGMFMARLLQGSRPVLNLLAENPFPDHRRSASGLCCSSITSPTAPSIARAGRGGGDRWWASTPSFQQMMSRQR